MDFFEHQAQARGRTRLLVLYFALALILIVVAVNAAAWGIAVAAGLLRPEAPGWWERTLWLWVTLGACGLILAGSLLRLARIAGSGRAVAEMVGAVPVTAGGDTLELQRLVNVVEEMAIASGVRPPALYVLNERGINAFVAGSGPSQATLVVTRGALEALDREQLQGVVAHEFSHLFYGDVRLNTRLIGLLAGVLLVGQAGLFLLRSLRFAGRGRRSDGRLVLVLVATGAALTGIGYIGLVFGRLIQAAVSRQREFLADAAAVQYTRNPDGIAGALAIIDDTAAGSRLDSRFAEDLAHICFGETRRLAFASLFASHPPLPERIRRIAPDFCYRPRPAQRPFPEMYAENRAESGLRQRIGRPGAAELAYAAALLQGLPTPLRQELHSPRTAKGVVYALLLAQAGSAEEAQGLALLQVEEGHDLRNLAERFTAPLRDGGAPLRLPVLELALPALERLPAAEKERFLGRVDALVRLDGRLSLFEYLLRLLLHRQLRPAKEADRKRIAALDQVRDEALVLLSALARAGHGDEAAAQAAFARATAGLFVPAPALLAAAACRPSRLHEAFSHLLRLSPAATGQLVEALATCALHDGSVAAEERELLRAACAVFDVPLPPLLPAAGDA